jgi:hypothetical protein
LLGRRLDLIRQYVVLLQFFQQIREHHSIQFRTLFISG